MLTLYCICSWLFSWKNGLLDYILLKKFIYIFQKKKKKRKRKRKIHFKCYYFLGKSFIKLKLKKKKHWKKKTVQLKWGIFLKCHLETVLYQYFQHCYVICNTKCKSHPEEDISHMLIYSTAVPVRQRSFVWSSCVYTKS